MGEVRGGGQAPGRPPVDLVLLDIMLPDDAPYPVVGCVHERTPGARIIAMSGQADRDWVAALMNLGNYRHSGSSVSHSRPYRGCTTLGDCNHPLVCSAGACRQDVLP